MKTEIINTEQTPTGWTATDDNYDGAPDGSGFIGHGDTEQDAKDDLARQTEESCSCSIPISDYCPVHGVIERTEKRLLDEPIEAKHDGPVQNMIANADAALEFIPDGERIPYDVGTKGLEFDAPVAKQLPSSLLPERLQRLNRELMEERTKSYDRVYAVREARVGMPRERHQVFIKRRVDNAFFASVQAVGRVFQSTGRTPADAYTKVVHQLRWGIDRWTIEDQCQRQFKKRVA